MSTAGSVRSGEQSQYLPPQKAEDGRQKRSRLKIFRWRGIIPIALLLVLLIGGWTIFGDRAVRYAITDTGSQILGTELDIADVNIRTIATSVEMKGVALANPLEPTQNLFEVGKLVVELEPEPLFEKKLVVKRLTIADVKTNTKRATPAKRQPPGVASRAMTEVQRFARQFKVPLLSLLPLDSLKALVLNPMDLKAVQAALAVGRQADSLKQAIDGTYSSLRIQETIDSSAALVQRLQGTSIRSLGIDGARKAVADVRRATARVDSAKTRVEQLASSVRRSADSLQAGIRAIDDARREDYDHARSLLQLPSVDAPDIGAALFGKVTVDKFEQALYWTSLARQYAPPGLLPREKPGPKRVRAAGTTVNFVTPASYPKFLLRRADVNVTFGGGTGDAYAMAASDVTTDPAIVGKPTLFAIRRRAARGTDSVRIIGSLDHTGARPRETVNASAAGLKLPMLPVPSLPFTMDPGTGSSELRFVFDGDRLSGSWLVRSTNLSWIPDSTRARKLNTVEGLVARVLTGVKALDLNAEISGTLTAPRLAVKSNLDRQVADQLRAVVGEQVAAATAKVRAQVDRIVEEKSAPVKAKAAELKAEGERRVAEARTKLDEE
jgi:uncharacterized protein (TIGR03545 family)